MQITRLLSGAIPVRRRSETAPASMSLSTLTAVYRESEPVPLARIPSSPGESGPAHCLLCAHPPARRRRPSWKASPSPERERESRLTSPDSFNGMPVSDSRLPTPFVPKKSPFSILVNRWRCSTRGPHRFTTAPYLLCLPILHGSYGTLHANNAT